MSSSHTPRPNPRPIEPDSAAASSDAPEVEGQGAGILTIRRSPTCRGWNGIHYKSGMARHNVGSSRLSMNVATIPPGAVAAAHIHVDFELMLYILAGRVRHYYGPQLDQVLDNEAGDFLYIEPGVPHEVHNLSSRDDVVAVVARSDADEWQNIVSYEVAGRRTPSPLEEATPASSPSRGERGTEGSTNDLAGGALSDVGLVETARDS